MPTVLKTGPYRFYFYAGDRNEPPHVHVERDDNVAKFWIDPVNAAADFRGRKSTEFRNLLKRIQGSF